MRLIEAYTNISMKYTLEVDVSIRQKQKTFSQPCWLLYVKECSTEELYTAEKRERCTCCNNIIMAISIQRKKNLKIIIKRKKQRYSIEIAQLKTNLSFTLLLFYTIEESLIIYYSFVGSFERSREIEREREHKDRERAHSSPRSDDNVCIVMLCTNFLKKGENGGKQWKKEKSERSIKFWHG